MATITRSREELYELYKNEVQATVETLTDFEEGSANDLLAGAMSLGVNELTKLIQDSFAKTFFNSANGPEVTQGPDDLQDLAVDHFGDDFARPDASEATGVVTFSRPTNAAGDVLIDVGTIVKTPVNANGESQRYATIAAVTMTGLSINASVLAIVAGPKGNVEAGDVSVIETALTDPTIVVTNAQGFGGGEAAENDATYRQTIKDLIKQLRGATIEAIEARARTVPGIVKATGKEFEQTVIEWNPAMETPIGDSFKIPRAKLYVADANGTANDALVALVQDAIKFVRAGGVRIDVIGATAIALNWLGQLSLDSGGPNFALFQTDPSLIVDSMTKYIQDLPIGATFDRILARAYILALWGPAGSGDLTDFQTINPAGNVDTADDEKLIPGTVGV